MKNFVVMYFLTQKEISSHANGGEKKNTFILFVIRWFVRCEHCLIFFLFSLIPPYPWTRLRTCKQPTNDKSAQQMRRRR